MRIVRWLLLSYLLLFVAAAGGLAAAEFIQQETYIVPAGEVIADDLYVSANEIIVEGRVEGDLIAFGSYLELNGTIGGDLLAAAAGVRLGESGVVEDDARLLTGSAVIAGRVGDDLVTTGSGNSTAAIPFQAGSRTVDLGIYLQRGEIGGDAALFGGLADLSGRIEGELTGFINSLNLTDVAIGRGADVTISEFTAGEDSRVDGENGFRYTAPRPLTIPPSLSEDIIYTELVEENAGPDLFTRLRQMLGGLAGFALVGWLLLRYRPNRLFEPAAALGLEPFKCLIVGFLVALGFLFVPVITLLVMLTIGFFWGFASALLAGGFVILGLVLIWIFSPLFVGLWAGRRFSSQPFGALMVGVALIILFRQIPLLGVGVSAVVFMAALGALILARPLTPLPSQV